MDLGSLTIPTVDSSTQFISGFQSSVATMIDDGKNAISDNAVDQWNNLTSTITNLPEVCTAIAQGIYDDAIEYGKDKWEYIKEWGRDTAKTLPARIVQETATKTTQKVAEQVPQLAGLVLLNSDLVGAAAISQSLQEMIDRTVGAVTGIIDNLVTKITDAINDIIDVLKEVVNYILMGEQWLKETIDMYVTRCIKEPIDYFVDDAISHIEKLIDAGIDALSERGSDIAAGAIIKVTKAPLKLAADLVDAVKSQVIIKTKTLVQTAIMSVLAKIGMV